jgi:hypothetical protein
MLPKNTNYIVCEMLPNDTMLVVASGKKKPIFQAQARFERENPNKKYERWPCRAKVGAVLTSLKTLMTQRAERAAAKRL